MRTLPLPSHTNCSLFCTGYKKSPLSKAEHVFHRTLTESVPVQALFARAARPLDSIPPRAPGTVRRCVTLLVYGVYLFHPHTFLVCSKDAMNGSAAGSVQCRCVQCSAHPNLRVVVDASQRHLHS